MGQGRLGKEDGLVGHLEVGTGCCHPGPGERGVLNKGWVGIVSWILLGMDKITAVIWISVKKRSGKEKPDSASSGMWARRRAGVEG